MHWVNRGENPRHKFISRKARTIFGEVSNLAKEMRCRSCSFMIRDENENELVSMAQQHNKNMHQMETSREDILRATREV